jgi:predicted RNase H-like nuclease
MMRAHGPTLPYTLVAGVIPCGRGWLVASAKLQGITIAPEQPRIMDSFMDVVDEKPAFSAVGLYSPIGMLDKALQGGRTCDREARALLGFRRGATVRSAPTWTAFEEDAFDPTLGLDAVTAALMPRYDEVAREMAPYRQRTVYEVHPELSFYQLNDDIPMQYPKRTEEGQKERRVLLESKIPGIDRLLDAEVKGATAAHLIDAAACMWTARRITSRAITRLPEDPEWDSQGLRMEIVR